MRRLSTDIVCSGREVPVTAWSQVSVLQWEGGVYLKIALRFLAAYAAVSFPARSPRALCAGFLIFFKTIPHFSKNS
ncbi:hypothetical protein LJC08_00020 [Methanimicrococcus sp. OttesenSCG-928-J09]|nr:hypothetical protein [Methanimicrococcus sp. OttesenSCG-928-J09]